MFDSRRYGNGANHVKVHTSEQVQQLLGALADEKDANGRTVMPFTYAVVVDMYATLMTKEKPSLQIDKQTDIITLRGKLWPLEEFLQSLGFIKNGNEMIVTTSAAAGREWRFRRCARRCEVARTDVRVAGGISVITGLLCSMCLCMYVQ